MDSSRTERDRGDGRAGGVRHLGDHHLGDRLDVLGGSEVRAHPGEPGEPVAEPAYLTTGTAVEVRVVDDADDPDDVAVAAQR